MAQTERAPQTSETRATTVSGLATDDRAYVDALEAEYAEAVEGFRSGGPFIWANLTDPSTSASERHHRLVKIALQEIGK